MKNIYQKIKSGARKYALPLIVAGGFALRSSNLKQGEK